MNCIIECDGGNNYSIPHMGKRSLERAGQLPRSIHATPFQGHVADAHDDNTDNDDDSVTTNNDNNNEQAAV